MSVKSQLREYGFERFSEEFAEHVITTRPEFERFLQVHRLDDLNFAEFNIPSANPKVSQPLSIGVESDRSVSVHWFEMKPGMRWDQEFSNTADWNRDPNNWPNGAPPTSETFESGLKLVDWICAEEVVPYVHHYRMQGWGGYGFCDFDALESRIAEQRAEGGCAFFRSWHGTYDRDLDYDR